MSVKRRFKYFQSSSTLLLVILSFLTGYAHANKNFFPSPDIGLEKSIFVVGHGWHTSLVIPRTLIPENTWPENSDFSDYQYLEVGWGDEGFYRANKVTLRIALKAVFYPTNSVLHIVGFNGAVQHYFSSSDIIMVALSEKGLKNLCQFISNSYYQDKKSGKHISLGPGIYGESRFYKANGKYYFPKTCNVWTARALESAGCPISSLRSIRAAGVIAQTRKFGVVIKSINH